VLGATGFAMNGGRMHHDLIGFPERMLIKTLNLGYVNTMVNRPSSLNPMNKPDYPIPSALF
jgi:hypothetical protein